MAIQEFQGDLSPPISNVTRGVVPIASSSFHDEAFLPQISLPASTSFKSSLKKRKLSTARIEKQSAKPISATRPRASTMSETEADKKRNKLGYQRISIACAHCRRRKIRCLLAEKDAQGRCQNCIRLKKECVFYPIDQQGSYETRSDEGGRHGYGSTSSSALSSTSPDMQTPHGRGPGRPPFGTINTSTTQTFQGMPVDSNGMYQGHYYPVDRPCQEGYEQSSPWPPLSRGYELPTPARTVSPSRPPPSHQYWSYEHPAATGDYAPFPNEAAHQVRTPTTYNTVIPHSSPEQQWQLQQPQTTRSMTYPGPGVTLPPSIPHYTPPFTSAMPQSMPPASFPPYSLEPESTPIMRGAMQGPPFTTPLPQTHVFPEHPSTAYGYRSPQTHSHPSPEAMPVHQAYPVQWEPSGNPLGFRVDEQQGAHADQTQPYVIPSQRPR